MTLTTDSAESTQALGAKIGARLRGGEVIELISDVGGGKTELVRGLARGMKSEDAVMSPTFTISRVYRGEATSLHHFDFYRLQDAGVMAAELDESIADKDVAVAIEWSDVVEDVLPNERLQVRIEPTGENERRVILKAEDVMHKNLIEGLA